MNYPVLIPFPRTAPHVPRYQVVGFDTQCDPKITVSEFPAGPASITRLISRPELRMATRIVATVLTPPFFVYHLLKRIKK